MKIYSLKFNSL